MVPDPPEDLAYLLDIFDSLARPDGANGPGSIPQTEIRAWQDNTGIRLQPWEIDVLIALDRAWMSAFHGGTPKALPAQQQPGKQAGKPREK